MTLAFWSTPVMAATLGIGLVAPAVWAVWRFRAGLRAERAETARRLDALSERLAAIEAPARGEARATAPATVRRIDPAEPVASAGPTLIRVPNLAAPASVTNAPAVASEPSARFAAIWELADAGRSAGAIARATGQPIGQVELILGLRRGNQARGSRPT